VADDDAVVTPGPDAPAAPAAAPVAANVAAEVSTNQGGTMAQRVLLVANRTLGGAEVAAAVRERVDAGATELWIVAPVAGRRGQDAVTVGGFAAAGEVLPLRDRSPDARAYEEAEQRVRDAVDRFSALGITVGGEVGDEDPVKAAGKAMSDRQFDEVVVSTLPTAASQWLRLDLPSRLQRKFKVPVATIAGRET
jgi:GABA permease